MITRGDGPRRRHVVLSWHARAAAGPALLGVPEAQRAAEMPDRGAEPPAGWEETGAGQLGEGGVQAFAHRRQPGRLTIQPVLPALWSYSRRSSIEAPATSALQELLWNSYIGDEFVHSVRQLRAPTMIAPAARSRRKYLFTYQVDQLVREAYLSHRDAKTRPGIQVLLRKSAFRTGR